MDRKEQFAFSHMHSPEFAYDNYSKAQTTEEDFDQQMDEFLFSSSTITHQSEVSENTENDLPSRRWKRPKSRAALEKQFNEKYFALFLPVFEYVQTDTVFNDLIDILGQLTTYVIYDRIWSLPVYRNGDEEEITQEGHIAAFEKLIEDVSCGKARSDALYYYLTIYKNKAKDYLSFYGLLKRKKDSESTTGTKKSKVPKVSDIRSAPSIESLTTNQDGEYQSDRMSDFSVNPFDDESNYHVGNSREILKIYIQELLENTNIPPAPLAVMYARVLYQMERLLDADSVDAMVSQYQSDRMSDFSVNPFDDESNYHVGNSREILKIYIQELLENTNIPPAPLAVMYARVLYQMERLLDADSVDAMVSQYMVKMNWSEDPEDSQYDEHIVRATEKVQRYANSTAPDWAIARMGKLTVRELGKDSEASLHSLFDSTLSWGKPFWEKCSTISDKFAPSLWGTIVYTDCYKKPQIENWATDLHNSTVVKAARKICLQQDLLEYILDELDDEGRLKGEVRKKQQKMSKQGGGRK